MRVTLLHLSCFIWLSLGLPLSLTVATVALPPPPSPKAKEGMESLSHFLCAIGFLIGLSAAKTFATLLVL